MKMISVFIDGFKNLSNVKIEFEKITALVSLNNFGKSNVLSGIDFGLEFIKASSSDKLNMVSNVNLIPLNKETYAKNYKFEFEISCKYKKNDYRLLYGYEFSWNKGDISSPKIINEILKIKKDEKGERYSILVDRKSEKALYKSSESGRCNAQISIGDVELVLNKLVAFDDLFFVDLIKKLMNTKLYMENNLDAKKFYQPNPFVIKGIENEMINLENLPKIIYILKKDYNNKFQLLKDAYLQLFPEFTDLKVTELKLSSLEGDKIPKDAPFTLSKSIYLILVNSNHFIDPIDISVMSDGAKRILLILTKIIVSTISNISLIAIEEPENSIHPSLFFAYIQIIDQLLDDCSIIITTHSPYILSLLKLCSIHVGISIKPGIAQFFKFTKRGQQKLIKDSDNLEISTGDYLFSLLSDPNNNLEGYLKIEK